MLEIRPNCECCNKNLSASSKEAMICSYECTFCVTCVSNILNNVCPNCAGGFTTRPIRPKVARRSEVSLEHNPASTNRVVTKYSVEELKIFSSKYKHIKPENR